MKTKLHHLITVALVTVGIAQAEMLTISGDQTAGTGSLTINQDINFTVTAGGSSTILFIFDEIVTSDGNRDLVTFSGLEYSVNGGTKAPLVNWTDNLASVPAGAITANDGYIYASSLANISVGQTVTLHAGTGTMTGSAVGNFNPWTSGDYDMFITDISGNALSNVVPEPSVLALVGVFGAGVVGIRRFFLI